MLGDLELPGVVTAIEVRGQYQLEKKKREGLSGSDKFGHGYNDAEVTISLEILPPDEEGQVAQIEKLFKGAFGVAGKPKPFRVVNKLLDSRDITTALFQGFTTRQGNEGEGLQCEIELLEYESLPRKQELQRRLPVVAGPNALPVPAATATYTPPNSIEEQFDRGLGAGGARAFQGANALTNLFGLPSNTPLPKELSAIARGEPVAQSFISGPE